jgi:transposase
MRNSSTIVSLDVHRDTIVGGALPPDLDDIQDEKRLGFNLPKLVKWCRHLEQRWGAIEVIYEAGGCGYVIYRELTRRGIPCSVIAPSLIPRKPGEAKKKSDRIDVRKNAKAHRAGTLTMVSVPTPEDEALRSVMRLRGRLVKNATQSRNQICSHLLRQGHVFREGANWTNAHWDWLKALSLPLEDEQFALDRYLEKLEFIEAQLAEVDQRIRERARTAEHLDRTARVMCLKGLDVTAAMVLIAETGDFLRFSSAGQYMDWVGMVPGVWQTGTTSHSLGITKAGNRHCRHILIQAAWSIVRNHPTASRKLRARWEGQPTWATVLSQRAMKRVHHRYWSLLHRGKEKQVAIVAAARELAGFVWAIMQPPEIANCRPAKRGNRRAGPKTVRHAAFPPGKKGGGKNSPTPPSAAPAMQGEGERIGMEITVG